MTFRPSQDLPWRLECSAFSSPGFQPRLHFVNDCVRSRSTRSEAHDMSAVEPLRTQLAGVGDLVGGPPELPGQLGELTAIIAFRSAHYHDNFARRGQAVQ